MGASDFAAYWAICRAARSNPNRVCAVTVTRLTVRVWVDLEAVSFNARRLGGRGEPKCHCGLPRVELVVLRNHNLQHSCPWHATLRSAARPPACAPAGCVTFRSPSGMTRSSGSTSTIIPFIDRFDEFRDAVGAITWQAVAAAASSAVRSWSLRPVRPRRPSRIGGPLPRGGPPPHSP